MQPTPHNQSAHPIAPPDRQPATCVSSLMPSSRPAEHTNKNTQCTHVRSSASCVWPSPSWPTVPGRRARWGRWGRGPSGPWRPSVGIAVRRARHWPHLLLAPRWYRWLRPLHANDSRCTDTVTAWGCCRVALSLHVSVPFWLLFG